MTFTLESLLPKAKPLPFAGIVAGELVGHRVWEIHKLDGVPTLRSWVYPYFWAPGGIASDIAHDAPGFEGVGISDYNERGIWAFATAAERDGEFSNYYVLNGILVLGTIWMWGTIIEHEKGYRSQYARVRGLDSIDSAVGDDLNFLRKRYGVGASE